MKQHFSFLFVMIALSLTGGCATFKKINVYTTPQEMAMGEVFSSEIEYVYPILHDPRITWYLNHRGRQLAEMSDRDDLPYFFEAIDTPELNAFAVPGGHIYFNLGMIEASETEAELLGVMAHEIGHVVAKHSMKQLSQQSIVSMVGTVALNQYPNQWAALAANLFGTTGFLKMSRDAEREADEIGFALMVEAGYHPRGMADMFARLLKLREKEPNLLDKLFSSHPPSQERIDFVRQKIEATQLPEGLVDDTEMFRRVHSYMVENYYDETYRRRWQEYLRQRAKVEQEGGEDAEDRLPWDRDEKDEDEARKDGEQKDKDKEKQEKKELARDGDASGPVPPPTGRVVEAAQPRPVP